ncbi:hypothetical protein QQG55_40235 [Brugia pahangi]
MEIKLTYSKLDANKPNYVVSKQSVKGNHEESNASKSENRPDNMKEKMDKYNRYENNDGRKTHFSTNSTKY